MQFNLPYSPGTGPSDYPPGGGQATNAQGVVPIEPGGGDVGQNRDMLIATLTAAAANGQTSDLTNFVGRGLQLGINVIAMAGTTPTLTVIIEGKDTASGVYYTILSTAPMTTTGFRNITVYPGALSTAYVSTPQPLPKTFRVRWAIGGTTPAVTATIGASIVK
ncbi:hypothetical protein PQ43W_39 [Ralstonia phage PQ43W]